MYNDYSKYDRNNWIHPTAIIDDSVVMGTGNTVGPYTMIGPNVIIGNHNNFVAHAAFGYSAQHREKFPDAGPLIIGDNNTFREFVTVNAPTTGETKVGNWGYFMACSHVSHDTVIEDYVTMANNVAIGGKSHIMRGATLGLGALLHQYAVVGSWAMVGMGSVIPKNTNIIPGFTYAGNPVEQLGRNVVGLERAKVAAQNLSDEVDRWMSLVEKIQGRK